MEILIIYLVGSVISLALSITNDALLKAKFTKKVFFDHLKAVLASWIGVIIFGRAVLYKLIHRKK